MKSITNKIKTKLTTSIMARRRAAANLLGLALGIGLTIALGGGVYAMSTGVFDSAATIATVEIQNARAYNTGDQAYVSLSVKNTGTEAATGLSVVVLLECNTEAGTLAITGRTDITRCDATNTVTTNLRTSVDPGAVKSWPIGSSISNLGPSETSSVAGGVVAINDVAGAAAAGASIEFTIGDEYLIEISGTTASGEPIIQTATVRPR